MKSIFSYIIVALCLAFASVASAEVCVCLDTYDQLGNHIGESGLFFVRDAGNAKTGQNGDPNVRSGYAYYTWDSAINGWRMVSKQELFAVSNLDFSKLMTVELYKVDQENMRDKVDSISNDVYATIGTVKTLIPILESLTNNFDSATVNKLVEDNKRLTSALQMITNITISADSTFGELKGAVSNVCAAASAALGGTPEFVYKKEEEPKE